MESLDEIMAQMSIEELDDPMHPKNKEVVHEIILDDELEASKTYDDLKDSKYVSLLLNKKMKVVQAWKKPEHDYRDPDVAANAEKLENVYYNTYRNGFVSALAMSHNFHLPLILSPNDVWLTVMQGFKIHMHLNSDKEYIKLSFKNLKKLDPTIEKCLVIDDPSIGDIDSCDQEKF